MNKYSRRLLTRLLHSGIYAATVFVTFHAQATTLGHSRVTSAPDQPLRIVVQIKELNPTDLKSLSARIAPVAAWEAAGLKPPVALNSLSTHLLPGLQDDVMQLVLQSQQVSTDPVIDVLVDLNTDASTQRHQVSVLQTQRPVSVQLTVTTEPVTAVPIPTAAAPQPLTSHSVKRGQNLYGIARTLRDGRYNDQQLMAALVETNPQAFINGNMNLLRAGANLAIPDAETVAAITPQQARQFYQTQLEQFDEYRQRIAKGEPAVTVPSPVKEKPISKELDSELEPELVVESNTDRLQLSAQSDEDAKKDQQTATAQELAHTAERLSQLEAGESTPNTTDTAAELDMDIATEFVIDDKSLSQSTAMTETLVSATINTASTKDSMAASTEPEKNPWWKTNVLSMVIGIFVLLVLLVTWFLRRAYSTPRMEDTENVPESTVRPRAKTDTAEAEFRENK